jgi:hypothetical protein
MSKKFGIGMTQKQADEFWRELVMMLIGVPLLIVIGVMVIDALLQAALGNGFGFAKYLLYGIGFIGWVVAMYKKYLGKILNG